MNSSPGVAPLLTLTSGWGSFLPSALEEVSGTDWCSGVGPSSPGSPEAPGVWPWSLAFEWSGGAWKYK